LSTAKAQMDDDAIDGVRDDKMLTATSIRSENRIQIGTCTNRSDRHYSSQLLPRVPQALGKEPKALGEALSFRGSGSRGRALPRVPKIVHSGKTSPSATVALGEDYAVDGFFFTLPRV
jgi:hypothetical protein